MRSRGLNRSRGGGIAPLVPPVYALAYKIKKISFKNLIFFLRTSNM